MDGSIEKISLTAEELSNQTLDYADLNTDVIVRFTSGDAYVATFFSFRNLEEMFAEYRRTREKHAEPYYKILNAVAVENLQTSRLLPVIEHMIVEGDFQVVFHKI